MFSASQNNFLFLFSNYPQISYKILQYLSSQECLELSLTSKTLQSSVNKLVSENLKQLKDLWMNPSKELEEPEEEEESKKEAQVVSKKKNKQKKNNMEKQKNKKWMKINLFEMDNLLKQDLINYKYVRLNSNLEGVDPEVKEKFFKENQNLVFQNEQKSQLIVINRSLVDRNLDFQARLVDESDSKYSEFFLGEGTDQKTYDFSDPKAMLERQKLILENLKRKELEKQANQDTTPKLELVLNLKKVTVILCHGGYFSIGIFHNNKPTFHKSDHKYVVRKKAGGRQITKDGHAGSNIQSMGSQIRRDQEKKHQENINRILTESFNLIKETDIVLYHAPGYNRSLIIDESGPLYSLREKFRSICLAPKKANYTEVERIYTNLVKLYIIPLKQKQ